MSDYWEGTTSTQSEYPREFLVSVELYVSTAAGAMLRRVCTLVLSITRYSILNVS